MSSAMQKLLAITQSEHPRLSSAVVFGGWLTGLGASVGFALALALVAVVATLDYVTGYELRLAILYLLPIALATWSGGARTGVAMSAAAAAVWFFSFRYSNPYSLEIYYYWEGAVMTATFLAFVFLLNRLRRALARADERFVRVLEGLYAGVYVVDADSGRVLYANQRLAQLVGVNPLTLHAADLDRRFAVSVGAETREPASFVSADVRDDTDGRWYLVQTGAIPWIDDRRVRLKVVTDISEQKQAQLLKRQHQEALHQNARLIALSEIASALAHELNQPLMAIAGYNDACLRLLAAKRHDLAQIRQAMEKCRDQSVRAGHIIHRMRDFIRRREPNLARVDINAVVREAVQMTDSDLEQAGVCVELLLPETAPAVQGDAVLIGQVLVNLIGNAIDAMQANERARRRVTISAGIAPAGEVRVSVRDLGTGISREMLGRLYEPFFTTKADGLGLGLCICRSVIEAHGGRLWHEAHAEGGSVFHFVLPADRA